MSRKIDQESKQKIDYVGDQELDHETEQGLGQKLGHWFNRVCYDVGRKIVQEFNKSIIRKNDPALIARARFDRRQTIFKSSRRTYRPKLAIFGDVYPKMLAQKKQCKMRQPKRIKNPFFAYRNTVWWQVRAEMPHLHHRNDIMREVRRRYYEMSPESRKAYAKRRRASSVRSSGGRVEIPITIIERLRRAEQRLKIMQPRGRRFNDGGSSIDSDDSV